MNALFVCVWVFDMMEKLLFESFFPRLTLSIIIFTLLIYIYKYFSELKYSPVPFFLYNKSCVIFKNRNKQLTRKTWQSQFYNFRPTEGFDHLRKYRCIMLMCLQSTNYHKLSFLLWDIMAAIILYLSISISDIWMAVISSTKLHMTGLNHFSIFPLIKWDCTCLL